MADTNKITGIHYEIMRMCHDPNSVQYKSYGAKGIQVAPKWHNREDFIAWAERNGYKPGMKLCRYDTSKNFSSHNCYFSDDNPYKSKPENIKRKIRKKRNKELKKEIGVTNLSSNRLYRVYIAMHERCENPNRDSYHNYGGRGIKVCKAWSGEYGFYAFYKWAMDNGYDENAKHGECTIDRINVNGNYTPKNCRFISIQEQMNNRRNTIFISIGEKRYPLSTFSGEKLHQRICALYQKSDKPLEIKVGTMEMLE